MDFVCSFVRGLPRSCRAFSIWSQRWTDRWHVDVRGTYESERSGAKRRHWERRAADQLVLSWSSIGKRRASLSTAGTHFSVTFIFYQGGYVFVRISLFVCLFVSRIMQNLLARLAAVCTLLYFSLLLLNHSAYHGHHGFDQVPQRSL